jgi:hypothetical protein
MSADDFSLDPQLLEMDFLRNMPAAVLLIVDNTSRRRRKAGILWNEKPNAADGTRGARLFGLPHRASRPTGHHTRGIAAGALGDDDQPEPLLLGRGRDRDRPVILKVVAIVAYPPAIARGEKETDRLDPARQGAQAHGRAYVPSTRRSKIPRAPHLRSSITARQEGVNGRPVPPVALVARRRTAHDASAVGGDVGDARRR